MGIIFSPPTCAPWTSFRSVANSTRSIKLLAGETASTPLPLSLSPIVSFYPSALLFRRLMIIVNRPSWILRFIRLGKYLARDSI